MAAARIPEDKRCPSGIEDLDKVIGGGFPRGGTVHITGCCGCGKTSLAMEFLVRGALKKEKGVYVSTTKSPEKVMSGIVALDIFDEKTKNGKALTFIDLEDLTQKLQDPKRPLGRTAALELLNHIEEAVDRSGAKRLVIDPISPLLMDMEPGVEREFIKKLGERMYKKRCTTVLITEGEADEWMIPLAADGIISMTDLERNGDFLRVLRVLKMSGAEHSRSRYVFDITSCGILMTPLIRGGKF
ncbi:MAG: circadian clock protein KaiC [Euryarchaeota archaeon]|nr:circadian clock protein KaiC [Euryarchaeota archaeon]